MRLLTYGIEGNLELTPDLVGGDEVPPYAILSHTWHDGQEVTFDDMKRNIGKNKTGYDKILFCAQQAKLDNLDYFWVDTCCIRNVDPVLLPCRIVGLLPPERWVLKSPMNL
jgi:hypothetical protein